MKLLLILFVSFALVSPADAWWLTKSQVVESASDGFVGNNDTADGTIQYGQGDDGSVWSTYDASAGGTVSYAHITFDSGQSGDARIELWHWTGSAWELIETTGCFEVCSGSCQSDEALLSSPTITNGDTYAIRITVDDNYLEIDSVTSTNNANYDQTPSYTGSCPDEWSSLQDEGDIVSGNSEELRIWIDNSSS